jgi:hypothetical protein
LPFPIIRSASAVLALACLAVSACAPAQPLVPASSQPTASQAPGTLIAGQAYLDAPIANATLRFLDAAGALVKELPNATDANGTFVLPSPGTFARVVASGGTRNGAAFEDELVADVGSDDPTVEPIALNPAMTLAARYRDAHPGTSADAAQAKVRTYFDLPEGANLGLDLAPDSFVPLATAGKLATLAAAIDGGHGELGAGTGTTKAVPEAVIAVGKKGVRAFATEVLNVRPEMQNDGSIFGHALEAIGFLEARPTKADLQAQAERKAILGAIEGLGSKIDGLSRQLTALSSQLEENQKQLLKAIKEDGDRTRLEARFLQLRLAAARIRSRVRVLTVLMDKETLDPKEVAAYRTSAIADTFADEEIIHSELVGDGMAEGIYKAYARMLEPMAPRLPQAGNDYLMTLETLHNQYQGVQWLAIWVVLEYLNEQKDAKGAQRQLAEYNKRMDAQDEAWAAVGGMPSAGNPDETVEERAKLYVDPVNKIMMARMPLVFPDGKFKHPKFGPNDGVLDLYDRNSQDLLDVYVSRTTMYKLTGWRLPSKEDLAKIVPGLKVTGNRDEWAVRGVNLVPGAAGFILNSYPADAKTDPRGILGSEREVMPVSGFAGAGQVQRMSRYYANNTPPGVMAFVVRDWTPGQP